MSRARRLMFTDRWIAEVALGHRTPFRIDLSAYDAYAAMTECRRFAERHHPESEVTSIRVRRWDVYEKTPWLRSWKQAAV